MTRHRGIPGMLLLTLTLMAAAPAPKPVITLDGIAAAVKLDAPTRTAIAKQVSALDEGLQKIAAFQRASAKATPTERTKLTKDLGDIHQRCMALHNEIIAKLDPTQQAAFYAYLHAQMKEAGIDVEQFQHDMMMGDSAHAAMHGAMSGSGHGG